MQNKRFKTAPIALTNTYTTNLLNPPTATGGTNGGSSAQLIYLKKIRVVNITASPVTFRLFLGATGANAAGSELYYDQSVPANDVFEEWLPDVPILSTDFLVGGASANTSLTIQFFGEIGVAG